MTNDPIADFIQRIKGASAVKKETVSIPFSALKYAVAVKLAQRGFIKSVEQKGKLKKTIEIVLSYNQSGVAKIHDVKRISKPGRRLYTGSGDIQSVKHGHGLLILSTPKGILAGDEAKKQNVGGESLFSIW